jgi:hypothetical protein
MHKTIMSALGALLICGIVSPNNSHIRGATRRQFLAKRSVMPLAQLTMAHAGAARSQDPYNP